MSEKTLTLQETDDELEIECKSFLSEITEMENFDQIHSDEAEDILNDMLRFGEYLTTVEKLISEGTEKRIAMFRALAVSPTGEAVED